MAGSRSWRNPSGVQEICEKIQAAVKLAEERWRDHRAREKAKRLLALLTPAEAKVVDVLVTGATNRTICRATGAQRADGGSPRLTNHEETEARVARCDCAAVPTGHFLEVSRGGTPSIR